MKKLFNQLMPYLNRKYYNGRRLSWMIEDVNGKPVQCFCCGNIADAVGEVKLMGWLFRLPVCKAHIRSYYDGRGIYSLSLPCTFPMNLKYRRPHIEFLFYPQAMADFAEGLKRTVDIMSELMGVPKYELNPKIFDTPLHNGPILGAADVLNPKPDSVEHLKN